MDLGSIIGGALSAVGNLGGAAIGANASKKATETSADLGRETNILNQVLYNQGLAYDAKKTKLQNDYNSASAVKQRYIDAGINPYLAMSGQSALGSGSGGSISAPKLDNPGAAYATHGQNMANIYGSLGANLGQTFNQVASGINIASKTSSEIQKNMAGTYQLYKSANNDTSRTIYGNLLNLQQMQYYGASALMLQEQTNQIKANIIKTRVETLNLETQGEILKIEAEYRKPQLENQVNLLAQQVITEGINQNLKVSEIKKNLADAVRSKAETELKQAQTTGQIADNTVKFNPKYINALVQSAEAAAGSALIEYENYHELFVGKNSGMFGGAAYGTTKVLKNLLDIE